MRTMPLLITAVLVCPLALSAQLPAADAPSDLARHDFLYAGESHDRKLFLVRGGKIVWSFEEPEGKGEISDAVRLANGNILFAHQFAVEEITPAKQVVWRYDVPAGHEVHTAIPIGNDRVLYLQNGDPALLRVVNIRSNVIEKELPLKTKVPVSVHGQFRHARLTANGTLLVAHMDLDRVVEYDATGQELRSIPAPRVWGVTPLDNGNILLTEATGVREVSPAGGTVWSWSPRDAPGYRFDNLQQAWRLPDGNTVINNWINEWNAKPTDKPSADTLQAIEVTPEKKVVWALHSWTPPNDLGPATTFQFLGSGKPLEDAHFGSIR